jgi:hypothetical protein
LTLADRPPFTYGQRADQGGTATPPGGLRCLLLPGPKDVITARYRPIHHWDRLQRSLAVVKRVRE